MRIIWETVRRTSKEILGVKGLIGGLRARTIPWFLGHFWKCSEVVEFWHVDTFKNGRKIKGSFLLWALQFSMIFIMGVFNFSDWTVFPGNDLHFICFCCWCKLFFFLHRRFCLIFNETPSFFSMKHTHMIKLNCIENLTSNFVTFHHHPCLY